MGGSTSSDTKTTTQNLTPQQQSLVDAASPLYSQFAASNPTLPGGAGVSPFDPSQTAGQEAVLGSAGDASKIVGSAGKENAYMSSGALLDPNTNPGFQGAIDAAARPINDQFRDVTLPGIASGASTNGSGGIGANFGGSRQGIAEGLASRGAANAVKDATAGVINSGYNKGLDTTLAAIGQAPGQAAAQTIPGTITSTVGDIRQGQAQNVLSANNAASQFTQWLPLLKAQLLTQGAASTPGGSATSVGTGNKSADPFSQLIGGASAAGGLAGGLSKLIPLLAL